MLHHFFSRIYWKVRNWFHTNTQSNLLKYMNPVYHCRQYGNIDETDLEVNLFMDFDEEYVSI